MRGNITAKKTGCIGCTACASICPTKAITMELNARGFYEPHVSNQECVMCGKCLKVCPTENPGETKIPMEQYACQHKDSDRLFDSSSGGAFVGIAEQFIGQGGIVFGAVYNEAWTGVYHASTNEVELKMLQKSKYVVSDLKDTFSTIQELINQERDVLFVGTPCQCAGLRKIVGDNPHAFIVDFICGGTPSAKAYRDYMQYHIQKYKSPIARVDFRGKDHGWKDSYLAIDFENGKKVERKYYYDPYFAMFYIEHLSTRTECDTCLFRKQHMSDLTLADFWGYRSVGISSDNRGLSLVAINTPKGKYLYDMFREKTETGLSFEQIAYAYADFNVSAEKQNQKESFLSALENQNFMKIYRAYVRTDRIHVFFKRVRSFLKI